MHGGCMEIILPFGNQRMLSESENTIIYVYEPTVNLRDLERGYIVAALSHFKKCKVKSSNALGITVKTLYNKLHAFGLFDEYKSELRKENNAQVELPM